MSISDDEVEAAARAFDPFSFQSWQQSYDYEMAKSADAVEAKAFADWCMGKKIEEARTGARAALTAAAKVRANSEGDGEVAWLAELAGERPSWAMLGDDPDEHFTTDPNRALRFARSEDAQAFIDHCGWNAVRPVEHMWMNLRAHDWFDYRGMECCRSCGNVRNATSDTRSCKGPVAVGLRASIPATGGEKV